MATRKPRVAAPTPARDEPEVAGLVVDAAATSRTGEDTRRRGWFWHWNSIVTQYAPLLGLKGVGLLNSYTVWTDRREESPHRGYAFPSQQSEADFYGEDRAELITINKILVALDLIEIRKEMVLRADPQGRRWRVPHNFYRVKDHNDGFSLTARQVMTVAQLADRDKAVYRYVRRVFSPRFAPIDGENVWHAILAEVRPTELWQRLAARTEKDESRASARTKAGHASRRAGENAANAAAAGEGLLFVPNRGDAAATADHQNDSVTGDTPETNESSQTSVASINTGSMTGVEPANTGLDEKAPTMVGPTNPGSPTAVALSNTTYHQSLNTTTTTGEDLGEKDRPIRNTDKRRAITTPQFDRAQRAPTPNPGGASANQVGGFRHTDQSSGPHGAPPPGDAPGEAAAIRAFAEANNRPATPAERKLLAGLAERFSATAEQVPAGGPATGWELVTAAIYEAVEAGSAFVAPRRLREILGRWEREGYPQAAMERADGGGSNASGRARREVAGDPLAGLGGGPEIPLPHGQGSGRTWEFVVGGLAGAIARGVLAELVAGTYIAGYGDGEVQVAVPDPARAEQLAGTYRGLIERKLSEAMRRPIRLAVVTPARGDRVGGDTTPAASPTTPSPAPKRARPAKPATAPEPVAANPAGFVIAECGLWSGQVWAAVLAELERNEAVGRADFEAWLRSTQLLGRGGEGGPGSPVIVGVPHALAQRRVSSRFQAVIAGTLAGVIGERLPVEIVVSRDWLAAHPASPAAPDGDETARAAGA